MSSATGSNKESVFGVWTWALLIVLAGFWGALLAGCSPETKYRLLSIFFDGVPKQGEEEPAKKRRARPRADQMPPKAKPAEARREVFPVGPLEERAVAERSTRWEEVEPILPKDAQGAVDWMRALEEGIIQPKSSLDPAGPELQPFPLDLELVPEGMPMFRVVFPHESHTRWYTCEGCHPKIFAMQKGADPITMEKIYAGEYCGQCHGTVAFDVPPNCARCHPALGGGP